MISFGLTEGCGSLRKTPMHTGVFRKLHQLAASPAASHPGYSISKDRLLNTGGMEISKPYWKPMKELIEILLVILKSLNCLSFN